MSVKGHKSAAPLQVRCAVVTVSDTRTEHTDKSGKLLKQYLEDNGHHVVHYQIIKDDEAAIRSSVQSICDLSEIDAVLLTGGTGISKRDVTIESVSTLFEKEIVGFGELFRMLSYTEDIGSASIMSRASAGTYLNKAIFIMPGSSGAVKLAMEKLILKELGHIISELNK